MTKITNLAVMAISFGVGAWAFQPSYTLPAPATVTESAPVAILTPEQHEQARIKAMCENPLYNHLSTIQPWECR